MSDYRESLSGPLADEYEQERWRVRRQQMHAHIAALNERDRRDTWMNVANRQLEERLTPYPNVMRPVEPRQRWMPPPIPERVEPPRFEQKRKGEWVPE